MCSPNPTLLIINRIEECPNSGVQDPNVVGVTDCLSWLAYLQTQSVNVLTWCANSTNFQKCCLTCQSNYLSHTYNFLISQISIMILLMKPVVGEIINQITRPLVAWVHAPTRHSPSSVNCWRLRVSAMPQLAARRQWAHFVRRAAACARRRPLWVRWHARILRKRVTPARVYLLVILTYSRLDVCARRALVELTALDVS